MVFQLTIPQISAVPPHFSRIEKRSPPAIDRACSVVGIVEEGGSVGF